MSIGAEGMPEKERRCAPSDHELHHFPLINIYIHTCTYPYMHMCIGAGGIPGKERGDAAGDHELHQVALDREGGLREGEVRVFTFASV